MECTIYHLPKHVVYLYGSEHQSLFDEMKKELVDKTEQGLLESFKFVKCEKSIPAVEDVVSSCCNNALLILDDLMFVATDCKENLNNYAMKDCHHQNIRVLFICQDIMYKNEKLRRIKSNSMYQLVFDNKGDRGNLHAIFHNHKNTINAF